MRVSLLVTLGALLAAAPTSAAAQRPEPRAPRAPAPPPEPRAPRPPSVARIAPDAWAFGFGDARADRATIGIVPGEAGPDGLRVAEVAEDGPAARAGIRAGDRLLAVGEVDLRLEERDAGDPLLRMTSERRLRRELERLDAGDEVTLRVAGREAERTVRVRTVRADALAEALSEDAPRVARAPRATTVRPSAPRAGTLYRTRPSVRDDRASVGLTLGTTGSARDTLGVFVAGVADDGPAERAGIHEGMRIAAVNGVDLRADRGDVDDGRLATERAARLERELARLEPGDEVTLRVWDGDRFREVRVRSARASEVYRDGATWVPGRAMRLAPGTTIFGMPGAERLRRLERLDSLDAPDVRVEIHGLDDLSPEERARVERRLEEARVRLESSRARMEDVRERLVESRVEERARAATVRARAGELRARARAEAAVRAMPTIVWPRRWMD
jgi:S1-C subfamily serine protease